MQLLHTEQNLAQLMVFSSKMALVQQLYQLIFSKVLQRLKQPQTATNGRRMEQLWQMFRLSQLMQAELRIKQFIALKRQLRAKQSPVSRLPSLM